MAPSAIVAFEDSGRGVQAAKAAGTFCVAVPHICRGHTTSLLRAAGLDSLALVCLDDLLALGRHPLRT
ncbi:hypothetical protein ABZ235_38450 [Streptomyces canus]|uniref:hypothetical protein n=1 Tax=Streptomyces canus TaxID=58343 RepID=UPI0033A97A81